MQTMRSSRRGRYCYAVRSRAAIAQNAILYKEKERKEIMYQKVSTDLKFVDREKKTEKFWAENQIFEKSMENRKEGETYTFYDGPLTANGKPHIGHVLWCQERPAGIPMVFR